MKPRTFKRTATRALSADLLQRVTVTVSFDASPAHGDDTSSHPPVRQRAKKARRAGTKKVKAPP